MNVYLLQDKLIKETRKYMKQQCDIFKKIDRNQEAAALVSRLANPQPSTKSIRYANTAINISSLTWSYSCCWKCHSLMILADPSAIWQIDCQSCFILLNNYSVQLFYSLELQFCRNVLFSSWTLKFHLLFIQCLFLLSLKDRTDNHFLLNIYSIYNHCKCGTSPVRKLLDFFNVNL